MPLNLSRAKARLQHPESRKRRRSLDDGPCSWSCKKDVYWENIVYNSNIKKYMGYIGVMEEYSSNMR